MNADPDKYKIVATTQDLNLVQNFNLQMKAWEKMSLKVKGEKTKV